MRLPTLFKQNKNKRFDYTPRYYDERKERLARLYEKHHGKKEDSDGSYVRRDSYRDSWKSVNRQTAQKKSQSNLIVIVILLFVIAYLVLDKFNIKLF